LVGALQTKRDLVVITNALNHAEALLANPSLTVIFVGGEVRRPTVSTFGELAVATLAHLHADDAFIATHSFSAAGGLRHPSFDLVGVKRAMIDAASRVTLLADGSKCGVGGMVEVAPLSAVHRIITSPVIPDQERATIEALGVELIVVDADDDAVNISGATSFSPTSGHGRPDLLAAD
jgi:DeoR/GlpR family transcriptional regulator of sugar metabolism